MTTDILLYQLRGRLASVRRRIVEATAVQPSDTGYLYAAGCLIELRSEAAFLIDLIADIEREEVTP